MIQHIPFDHSIGKNKPNQHRGDAIPCPFCDFSLLKQHGEMIHTNERHAVIRNKFPSLHETCEQYVLVEHTECGKDLSNYTKEELISVMTYSFHYWQQLLDSGKYQSVAFFKNHGPYSGGSILHAHMQFLAFPDLDCHQNLHHSLFKGEVITHTAHQTITISTHPMLEFYEFNIQFDSVEDLPAASQSLQYLVQYILSDLNPDKQSFNLFFYHLDEQYYIKIVSRNTMVSPVFAGYQISQVPNSLKAIAADISTRFPFE